jgi:hypothetical protein
VGHAARMEESRKAYRFLLEILLKHGYLKDKEMENVKMGPKEIS